MSSKDLPEEAEQAIREAAAYILASRYRSIGAPVSKVIKILKKSRIPLEECLKELERRFEKIGLKLKRVRVVRRSRRSEIFVAVIDPAIKLGELRPYSKDVMGVLALIFFRSKGGEIFLSVLRNDLLALIGDEEKVDKLLRKALKKLEREKIIRLDADSGKIILTELGQALMPPPELIDEIVIDMLAKGPGGGD
ncbi:MAG: hypothetical protein ACTSX9_01415 [Candidatus Njordarchaeales archaeon]